MFIQLILHWFGDYLTQSDWMALNKTKRDGPCFVHCILYTLPFYFITGVGLWGGLAIWCIFWSHFFIDRYSLAKYLIWLKNHLNPTFKYHPFYSCRITGYRDDALTGFGTTADQMIGIRPLWLTMLLYIITDNGLHIVCNYLALKYL